jgi:hypothetical protein
MAGKDNVASVEAFIEEFGLDGFAHLGDQDGSVWAEFEIRSQPAWVFLNDDGTLETFNGPLGAEGLTTRLEALIAG